MRVQTSNPSGSSSPFPSDSVCACSCTPQSRLCRLLLNSVKGTHNADGDHDRDDQRGVGRTAGFRCGGWWDWDWIHGVAEGDTESADVEAVEVVVDAVSGGLSQCVVVGGADLDLELDVGVGLGVEAEISGGGVADL